MLESRSRLKDAMWLKTAVLVEFDPESGGNN